MVLEYIIIDLRTLAALYGAGGKTLKFSSKEIALEVASQFFNNEEDFIVVSLKKE